ncbi:MAG TPA: hypothetical protein VHU42_07430 [Rhodopila sp.]|jgi:hypothetical protein|nr:hypothetical protein [Rhodopila sp.]
MRAFIAVLVLAGCLGGCATLPSTENTPYLPPGVFGTYLDNDTGAINYAAWAFASPANTRSNPAGAARAIVALEYLPGELSENPRWIGLDSLIAGHMNQAREDLRGTVGIRPDAPPQVVVNTLLALSWNLQTGNQPAAMEVLTSPVFTRPPAQTLQILSNLPYEREANLATSRAANQNLSIAQGLH